MKKFTIATFIVVCGLLLTVGPMLAQQSMTPNTITVVGLGSASGMPDIANLEVGVETVDADLATAYNNTNMRIDAVIGALTAAGVAREDIRTIGLNVYQDRYGGPVPEFSSETGEPTAVYIVSNNVRVTVRDIDNVPSVLNAAIDAGATNVFGLNFSIENATALASNARAEALEDAQRKATELAELASIELGTINNIIEIEGGFDPFNQFAVNESAFDGVGGAAIEPGQLSVNVRLQVTFDIDR